MARASPDAAPPSGTAEADKCHVATTLLTSAGRSNLSAEESLRRKTHGRTVPGYIVTLTTMQSSRPLWTPRVLPAMNGLCRGAERGRISRGAVCRVRAGGLIVHWTSRVSVSSAPTLVPWPPPPTHAASFRFRVCAVRCTLRASERELQHRVRSPAVDFVYRQIVQRFHTRKSKEYKGEEANHMGSTPSAGCA